MKSKRPLIVISIIFVFSLACQTLVAGGNGTDVPTQTQEATPRTTDSPSSPLTGLTFSISERNQYAADTHKLEIWQFGNDGKTYKVFEGDPIFNGPYFSPDGKQMVYSDFGIGENLPECMWLVDYEAKTISSLICGGFHDVLQWLPGQPDKLLSLSSPFVPSEENGFQLEIIALPNGTTQILDAEKISGAALLSPDGQTIVYQSAGFLPQPGWLYSLDSGTEPFNPQDYGVDYSYFDNPVWSPDGKKIAWGLMDVTDFYHPTYAIGVFNLENKTGVELHPFKPDRRMSIADPYPPSTSWSPDGKWLTVDVCALGDNQVNDVSDLCDPALSGRWIVSEDGQTEYKIGTDAGGYVDFYGPDGWSPDSEWITYTITNNETNKEYLWVSRLDGSNATSLGEVTANYFFYLGAWSPDGKYLAFEANHHIWVAETGIWQPQQVGETGIYNDLIWSPDGKHLAFMDETHTFWVAETGVWQPEQIAKIELPENFEGDNSQIYFDDWQNVLLPSFDTLTVLPPGTPVPSTTNPTETSSDCSNSVVLTAKDTSKGEYLEVCSNDQSYEIGPLAKGAFAVGPNNKFFIYCANNGLVYGVRVGDTKLQLIGDVKDFSAILRDDIPIFQIEFTGSDPYKVTIREIGYKQNKTFSVPRSVSAP